MAKGKAAAKKAATHEDTETSAATVRAGAGGNASVGNAQGGPNVGSPTEPYVWTAINAVFYAEGPFEKLEVFNGREWAELRAERPPASPYHMPKGLPEGYVRANENIVGLWPMPADPVLIRVTPVVPH